MKTNRRGAIQSAVTGLLALLAAPFAVWQGQARKPKREPWRCGTLDRGPNLVRTLGGKIAEVVNPRTGYVHQLRSYEVRVELNGTPLVRCCYADEAAGVALTWDDSEKTGWAHPHPNALTGRVQIIADETTIAWPHDRDGREF